MFGSLISFKIPVYQRAYSWDKSNWEVFLEDIKEQINLGNEYSYGNILLETILQGREYEIIDGQQRLSTLIIFMRALINVLKEKGHSESDIAGLEEDFMQRRGIKKLRPVDYDQVFFDTFIIDNNYMDPSSDSQERYQSALDFFDAELNKLNLQELIKIKDLILKTKINRLELEGKSEAALMFELQNNRGKDLTNLEKLKSYFLYQVYINSKPEETETNVETISNYFKEIYKTHHDIKGVKEDSILIYHCNAYLKIAYGYRGIEDIKKEYKESEDKVRWIKDFSYKLSQSFKSIKSVQQGDYLFYNKLKNIAGKNNVPAFAYPFIIKGYTIIGNERGKIESLLHLLEIVAFRYFLIGSRAELNSRLSDIIRSFDGNLENLRIMFKKKLNESWYWSDNRTKEFLSGYMYENPVLHYLLWEYENYLQRKGYTIGDLRLKDEEIEHISPQNPPEGESIAIGYDVNEDGEYSDGFIENSLNSIGNLMLISKSHNASIGNKPFEEKLKTYKETPLLRQHMQVEIFLDEGRKEWKEPQINKRKDAILEFAFPNWDFDKVEIK